MRLYVANPTQQNQIVCYRLDFDNDGNLRDTNRRFSPAKQQEIPPGRQVQLGGDMHIRQIQDIEEQLRPYGLRATKEVQQGDMGDRVVPLVFNMDQPVPSEVMRKVQGFNAAVLIDQGKDRRAKAAVASNHVIHQTVSDEFARQDIPAEPPEKTTVGFEQLETSELGENPVAEGYRVDPNAPAAPSGKRGFGRSKKR